MKKQNAIRIDELIRRAIEESGNSRTYDEQRVCYLWAEAVGPTINRFTTARWIRNGELHVTIAGGVVKSEVTFMSDAIIERLNQLAGTTANPVVSRLIVH